MPISLVLFFLHVFCCCFLTLEVKNYLSFWHVMVFQLTIFQVAGLIPQIGSIPKDMVVKFSSQLRFVSFLSLSPCCPRKRFVSSRKGNKEEWCAKGSHKIQMRRVPQGNKYFGWIKQGEKAAGKRGETSLGIQSPFENGNWNLNTLRFGGD